MLLFLIPKGLLEHNLGINIVTEIIGIVFTIFIIEKLLHWNEERLWKKVKNQVYYRLGEEIYYIIIDLRNFIDLPPQVTSGAVSQEENLDEFRKRKFFESLDYLCCAESISMNEVFRKIITNGGYGEIYSKREKYLSDIEAKYFRFLTPDILIPLMNLQRRLHSLDLKILIRQKRLQRGWLLLQTEDEFYEMISRIVLLIFTEICKLKEVGLQLYLE